MADGNAARRLNLSFMDESLDDLVRQQAELDAKLAAQGYVKAAPSSGSAGLNEGAPPPPKKKGNLDSVKLPPIPEGKIRAKDIRTAFPSLPAWQGVPGLRTAPFKEARSTLSEMQERAAKGRTEVEAGREKLSGVGQAQADAVAAAQADYDRKIAAAEALRPTDRRAADKMVVDAGTALDAERDRILSVNSVDYAKEAQRLADEDQKLTYKQQSDKLNNANKKKAEARAARTGKVKAGAKGGVLALGGLYLADKAKDWITEDVASDPEGQAAREISGRLMETGQITADEANFLRDYYGPERVALMLSEADIIDAGGPPASAPGMTYGPTSLLGESDFMPPRRKAAPSAPAAGSGGLIDVDYNPVPYEGAPDIPGAGYDVLPLDDKRAIEAERRRIYEEGGQPALDKYDLELEAEDVWLRMQAMTDAGMENTAAAVGAEPAFMEYVRRAGEYARAKDAGRELPELVPDGLPKRAWDAMAGAYDKVIMDPYEEYLAGPAREGWELMLQDKTSPVSNAINNSPEWLQDAGNFGLAAANPLNWFDYVLAPMDERAAQPYELARKGIGALQASGAGEFTDPLYREFMRGQGAELLGNDPLDTSVASPLPGDVARDREEFEAFSADARAVDQGLGGSSGGGTGVSAYGMPGMEDLKRLEEIGALGRNPDGSNMTIAQYIQQGNLAGAGMEAGLPMFAGSPMPPQMGTMIPEDPRLGPMPKPNLPQLPMAPSDLPISVLPPQGMPGDFLDENAADFRRADMEWQKMATMLGLTPTGEPTRGRAPPKEPGAAPPPVEPPTIEPGGQGDQWADVGTLLGFGPAYASTIDDPEAVDVAVSSLVDGDEVLNPRGQAQPEEKPRGWADWLTYGLLDLDGDEPQPAAPAAPAVAPGSVVGGPGGLSMGTAGAPAVEMPTTPSGRPAPGAVGDLNTSRERGAAGLAEDAEAAEEELNWINRQMRDKLGMTDASERAKAAEALVSFGSTLLASKGDTWQAIGEGLQAGLGSVTAANDEEKAALAAQQDAMLEDARWRAEFALEELRARKDAGTEGGMPKKLQEVTEYVDWLMAMDPTLTLDAAQDMAERYLGIKSQEAWSTNPYALPEEG